jgi:hypothetical protein
MDEPMPALRLPRGVAEGSLRQKAMKLGIGLGHHDELMAVKPVDVPPSHTGAGETTMTGEPLHICLAFDLLR